MINLSNISNIDEESYANFIYFILNYDDNDNLINTSNHHNIPPSIRKEENIEVLFRRLSNLFKGKTSPIHLINIYKKLIDKSGLLIYVSQFSSAHK